MLDAFTLCPEAPSGSVVSVKIASSVHLLEVLRMGVHSRVVEVLVFKVSVFRRRLHFEEGNFRSTVFFVD